MAGVVLETLSNRKLGILAGVLLLAQIVAFLIGGLIGLSQFHYQNTIWVLCEDLSPVFLETNDKRNLKCV